MVKILRVFLVVLILFLAVTPALAAPGIRRTLNFQGKVVNTDGTNVTDGNYNFTFKVWDSLTVGTSLWTEIYTGASQIGVSSGIFSVDLGGNTAIGSSINFNSDSLYLSVNFNGNGDMSPRIQLSAVPYAFNAEKVNGLTVTNTNSVLSIGESKLITFGDNFTTTAVGITLDQSLATTNNVTFAGLSIGGSVSVTTNLSVGGSVSFTNIPIGAGTTILYINSSGSLVAGTLPPGGTAYTATNGLNLNGSAFGLGGTLTENRVIGTSSFSLSFMAPGNDQSLFIGATGYVGIGTTNPRQRLEVDTGVYDDTNPIFGVNNNAPGSAGNYWPLFGGHVPDANVGAQIQMVYGRNGADGNRVEETFTYFGLGSTSNMLSLGFYGNNNPFNIQYGGNVGIGTTNPSQRLSVAGSVSIGGSLAVTTNISVGGSVAFSAIPLGVGSSVLYISSTGNLVQGTLPASSAASNSIVMVLSPEYAGASLSADGSATTDGAMTSDNTLNAGSVGWKNYYQWTSTNASSQDYSIIVRITLPSDFDTWETGSCPGSTCALELAYQTGLAATTNNSISYIVSNDSDTPATAVCTIGSTANSSWGSSGCTEAVLNDASAPEWDAAGETAVIRIKMAANNTGSALVRAGDIILRYKSKF